MEVKGIAIKPKKDKKSFDYNKELENHRLNQQSNKSESFKKQQNQMHIALTGNSPSKKDLVESRDDDKLSECISFNNTEPFSMAESINVDTIDNMLENKKSMATVDSIYIDGFGIDSENNIMLKKMHKNLGISTDITTKEDKKRLEYELSINFETFGERTVQGNSANFTMRTVESKIIDSITMPTFRDELSNLESNRTVDSIYINTAQASLNNLNFSKKDK